MRKTNKQIRLDHIVDVLDIAQGAYECLAATVPLIRNPDKFAMEFCHVLLATKPPVLFQQKDGYYLVAGFREWQLALRCFDKAEKITCQVIADVSTDFLKAMAWADAYGCMLLYGLNPKEVGPQLRQASLKLDKDIRKAYFPEVSKTAQLARAIGISRDTFYGDESAKEEAPLSFDDVLAKISANKRDSKK